MFDGVSSGWVRKLSIELTPGDQEEIEMEENHCFILKPCGSMVFSSLIQLDSESLRSSVEGVEICSIAMICMWERVWFGKLKCLVGWLSQCLSVCIGKSTRCALPS